MGPADTALNILLALGLDREEAWRWHQHVKGRFVAKLPREGGTISGADVLSYVAELRQKIGGMS